MLYPGWINAILAEVFSRMVPKDTLAGDMIVMPPLGQRPFTSPGSLVDFNSYSASLYGANTADLSGMPPSYARFNPQIQTSLENLCLDQTTFAGPVHPRVWLVQFIRTDALQAMAGAGLVPSAAPPDTWEDAIALLEAHRNALRSGTAAQKGLTLPTHGLCVTPDPNCGRVTDLLPAVAASVVQTGGTAKGYAFDLTPPPPAAAYRVIGPGWSYAMDVVRRLMSYNAPNDPDMDVEVANKRCKAVHPAFVRGDCLLTFEWDQVWEVLAGGLLGPGLPRDAWQIAVLPGSRLVVPPRGAAAAAAAGANQSAGTAWGLVPCTPQICAISANHELLYGRPASDRAPNGDLAAATAAAAAAARSDPGGSSAPLRAARCGQAAMAAAAAAAATVVRQAARAQPPSDFAVVNRAPYSALGIPYVSLDIPKLTRMGSVAALTGTQYAMAERLAIPRVVLMNITDSARAALFDFRRSNGSRDDGILYSQTAWWLALWGTSPRFDTRLMQFFKLGPATAQSQVRTAWHNLHHPNVAPDVASPNLVNYFRWAIGHVATSLVPPSGGGPKNDSVNALPNATEALTEVFNLAIAAYSPSSVRAAYEVSIAAPAWTSPKEPAAPPPPVAGSPSSGGGLEGSELAGVIVGCVVGGLLLLALIMVVVWRRREAGRGVLGNVLAPRPGPNTTLLITDIQNSTTLWDSLPPDAMDAALKSHHEVLRRLLHRHGGYESATEGDAFILAFAHPAPAVEFAAACQVALLAVDWPPHLLAHPDACTIILEPAAAAASPEPHAGSGRGANNTLRLGAAGRVRSRLASRLRLALGVGHTPSSAPQDYVRAAPSLSEVERTGASINLASMGGPPQSPIAAAAAAAMAPVSAAAAVAVSVTGRTHSALGVSPRAPGTPSPSPFAQVVSVTGAAGGTGQPVSSHGEDRGGGLTEELPVLGGPWDPIQTGGFHGFEPNGLDSSKNEDWDPSVTGGNTHGGASGWVQPQAPGTGCCRTWAQQLASAWRLVPPDRVASGGTATGGGAGSAAGSPVSRIKAAAALWPAELPAGAVVAFRGLRVRMGLHSGADEENAVVFNETNSTFKYQGMFAKTAKLVSDAAPGGMVVLSAEAFARLRHTTPGGAAAPISGAAALLSAAPRAAATAAAIAGGGGSPLGRANSTRGPAGGAASDVIIVYGGNHVMLRGPAAAYPGVAAGNACGASTTPSLHGGMGGGGNSRPSSGPLPGVMLPMAGLGGGFARNGGGGGWGGSDRTPRAGEHRLADVRAASAAQVSLDLGTLQAPVVTSPRAVSRMPSAAAMDPIGTALYLAVPPSLVCRLALAPPLRTAQCVQTGTLGAPTGRVCIAFMKVVGASTLLADLPGPAARALETFHVTVLRRLGECARAASATTTASTGFASAGAAAVSTGGGGFGSYYAAGVSVGAAGGAPDRTPSTSGLGSLTIAAAAAGLGVPSVPAPLALPGFAGPGVAAAGGGAGGGGGGSGSGAFLVEAGEGLVLAAFASPRAAVEWALDCLEELHDLEWEEELLTHELCEEVLSLGFANVATPAAPGTPGATAAPIAATAASGTVSGAAGIAAAAALSSGTVGGDRWARAGPEPLAIPGRVVGALGCRAELLEEGGVAVAHRVLDRGLRVKVGLDVGLACHSLTESSGRLSYRGRVMNRAARIAGKAAGGQVVCSGPVWSCVESEIAAARAMLPRSRDVVGMSLGKASLKGIANPVELVQCLRRN
ncbi:hypothetical protein HYH03_015493 [Edaphochlamys debaryana]|uniref:Guanylate cyclase domain-containing protein n=1 Tax=Edaphochlamys debaryana TaxID=47281 RepID=A0A835XP73_9CHLO|nr:hypothetical protein HYH03_015493 [Edaphochlamys debaryana]|eukprot:KAG2485781.1 hypothetical protein HYH03_015493 [Edaphochlamys debaryana]